VAWLRESKMSGVDDDEEFGDEDIGTTPNRGSRQWRGAACCMQLQHGLRRPGR